MLSLIINEQNVDLGDDFSFTMNLKSPMFNDIGNYSYPFRIPVTARNAILLGFPHRAENTAWPFIERQARFEWNGITLFSGTAKLKTAGPSAYEGTIFDSTGDFYYQLKNRSLQQIDMGEMIFADEFEAIRYFSDTLTKYYPEAPVACPQIQNKNYFDPPVMNTELEYYNYEYPGNDFRLFTVNTNERTIIVPMLYLRHVLKLLFAGLGYTLDDRFFSSHPDFNRLAVYNSTSCNNGGETTPPREPKDYSISHLILNYHVPRIGINEFLKSLEDFFALAIFVDNTTRGVRLLSLEDIINASGYREFSSNLISSSVEYEEQPSGYQLSMSLDPDDQASSILTGYEDLIIDAYAGSVPDLASLPHWPMGEIGSVFWVEDQINFYQMQTDKTWAATSLMSLLRTRFLFRTGDQKLDTKFSPIYFDHVLNTAVVTNPMSRYRQITPRLMFVEQYTLFGNYGMRANFETNNFSLYYPWEKGLFNLFWKNWLSFKSGAKLVKFTKQMSFTEIREFDFATKYMIRGRKYLMRSLQVTIKRNRIAPVSLEGYLCGD